MSTDFAERHSNSEAAAVPADVRIAEAQIARGEGIGHDAAERLALQALRSRAMETTTAEVVSAQADSVKS